jgi:predicted PurR-regulated permease PerM
MIRFFGFLIRFVLSILLVVLGLVFLGPFLVKSVDQWMGKAEEYRSITEQFQVIDQVRDWFDEKEICEVKFEDLLGLLKRKVLDG